MAITIGTPVVRKIGGISQVSISQSAAASGETIVADPGDGFKVVLISLIGTLDADGTVKVVGGASGADLTGAFDIAGKTGLAWKGTLREPFLEAAPSEALKITTTGGAFRGVATYKIVTAQ